MRKGVDVSSYQGKIDWEKTKDYIDFAIIRCGYGNNLTSQDDPRFKDNADSCTDLKIPFGVYLYSYATNTNMAQSEVDHTLRLIKDYKLEYPVFLDVEDRSQLSLTKERLVEIVRYYCEKIEEAGYYVGIYASLSTLNGILNSPLLDAYDKWVAEWAKDFTYVGSSGLWQNTDNDRIPGIDTRVDGDIAFYDYPQIIRQNDLNNLGPKEEETVPLKYKEGDTLYLNGSLYKDKDGKEVKRNYRNQKVTVKKTYNEKGVVAPYELNIGGFSNEESLSKDKVKRPNFIVRFFIWLINLFRRR